MAYESPSVNEFTSLFPRFIAVDPLVVQDYLTQANRFVDQTWNEGDYKPAIMLYAAHLLTMEGLGAGQEAAGFRNGTNAYKTIRSGSLSLERFSGTQVADNSGLASTSYGKRYKHLLRLNKGGARSTTSVTGVPYSHLAYDWPR